MVHDGAFLGLKRMVHLFDHSMLNFETLPKSIALQCWKTNKVKIISSPLQLVGSDDF